MANPLLALTDSEGPVRGYRYPLSDEARVQIKEEEEKEKEEENYPSPLAMGLLQLGASMMRDEGWKDRPITLGESIGKAIPRGIAGYYNQDMLNRQYEAEANQQRLLEEAASQQAALEEATRLQKIEEGEEKVRRYKAFVANVDSIPDAALSVGGDSLRATNRRENLKQLWLKNPEEAMKKLEDIWKKHEEVANRPASPKTYAEFASEKKSATLEKRRLGIQNKIAGLMAMGEVPEVEKQKIQTLYGDPDTLTEADLIKFPEDYAMAMGTKKLRDYTNEYQRKYEFLKKKENWDNLTPQEKRLVKSTQFTENKKEGLDVLTKMMEASEYQADWQLVEETPEYDLEGNEKKVVKRYVNRVTGKEYQEVTRGALGSVKIESMTGAAIKAKYKKWKDANLDDEDMYTIETDLSGNVRFAGTILDLTEKDPDKSQYYADNMLMSAVNMGLISQTDAFEMGDWEPDSVIRNLNTLFIKDKEKASPGDPNAGLIKSGTEINIALDPTGKRKVFKEDKNYYWDGTTWKDIDEGDAQTLFANESKLRFEYDKNTKKFKDSIFAYNSIVAGYKNSLKDPASAGVNDIMIVRSFLLMIEPNSVVRESEFATAAKSQGMYQYTLNLIDKMQEGAILTQASRRRFFNAAMGYMGAVKRGYDIQGKRYTKIAKAHNIEPKNIIVDIFADSPELQEEGEFAYEPYQMKKPDWDKLKNTHKELMPPKKKKGSNRRTSNLPKLNL